MGARRRDIDPKVKAIVLEWGRAPTLEDGEQILSRAGKRLSPAQRAVLCGEVAEINAETLDRLLDRRDGLTDDEPLTELFGLHLHPLQLERLSSWVHDQPRLARALGLSAEEWLGQMQGAIERYLERSSAAEAEAQAAGGDRLERGEGADALGRGPRRAPAGPADRKTAGILGMIAANKFKLPRQ
ncbi:MAG: hypothetical protein IT384_31590 [Deltaproteobacteria bacterium]|nr:hypothetical protein [Deltaproteobacteria bacterium]